MIGLGETFTQVKILMDDLRDHDVDFITIGQYLRPSMHHHPVIKYHEPEYFVKLYEEAMNRGFKIVSASPFTRSSFHAEDDFLRLKKIENNA